MECQQKYKSTKHYVQAKYFKKVIEGYAEFREFQPLVAINYDPAGYSKKLHPAIVHFIADVDIATAKVLMTPRLLAAWHRLANGEEIPAETQAEIVSKCSRIYQQRGLAPYEYFRAVKKPLSRGAAA